MTTTPAQTRAITHRMINHIAPAWDAQVEECQEPNEHGVYYDAAVVVLAYAPGRQKGVIAGVYRSLEEARARALKLSSMGWTPGAYVTLQGRGASYGDVQPGFAR